MYNDTVIDHFANPRNVGEIKDADGIGRTGNPVDGDTITIYIKVRNETLYDIKFKTFGCGAAIAASSMLTVLAIGKSLEYGMTITNDDVAEALGGLPPQKLLCSNIAANALHAAINDYFSKNIQNHTGSQNIVEAKTENTAEKPDKIPGLTDKNQIQRYLRHIIMPEISGAGQRKLLETHVLLCAQNINACDVLLNYMAASGIGKIYFYLENKSGCESVMAHIHDLNPDINIISVEEVENMDITVDFKLIIGELNFAARICDLFKAIANESSPLLISVNYSWQGYIKLCNNAESVKEFLAESSKECTCFSKSGISISCAFAGTFIVIELVKARLNIGNILKTTFYFDLWNMLFDSNVSIYENNFNDSEKLLTGAKVLIVGTGGLGCPVALMLAKSGIGTIGLIDFDNVEISNLNRQILHTTSKIGLKKVESAMQALKSINDGIKVELYPTSFSKENAMDIIKNYDIIVDGLDNIPTRYLLNDACFFGEKPLIEAGALTFYGQVTTIIPGDGPCYRCIFPESTIPRHTPSCSETGILGPVPGLLGIIQAVEVIKMVMGIKSALNGGLLVYDALETELEVIGFNRNKNCKLCGENPTMQELGQYTFVCKDKDS